MNNLTDGCFFFYVCNFLHLTLSEKNSEILYFSFIIYISFRKSLLKASHVKKVFCRLYNFENIYFRNKNFYIKILPSTCVYWNQIRSIFQKTGYTFFVLYKLLASHRPLFTIPLSFDSLILVLTQKDILAELTDQKIVFFIKFKTHGDIFK